MLLLVIICCKYCDYSEKYFFVLNTFLAYTVKNFGDRYDKQKYKHSIGFSHYTSAGALVRGSEKYPLVKGTVMFGYPRTCPNNGTSDKQRGGTRRFFLFPYP